MINTGDFNDGYTEGYNDGFGEGYNGCAFFGADSKVCGDYDRGYNSGFDVGYNKGFPAIKYNHVQGNSPL